MTDIQDALNKAEVPLLGANILTYTIIVTRDGFSGLIFHARNKEELRQLITDVETTAEALKDVLKEMQ